MRPLLVLPLLFYLSLIVSLLLLVVVAVVVVTYFSCFVSHSEKPVHARGENKAALFERSEFLIATCKKKKTDRLCVSVRMFG